MARHPTNEKGSRAPGRGREPESGQREARRKGSGWVVALPAFVRRRLGITEPRPVYWHLARKGEAVVSITQTRRTGAPDTTSLHKELEEAKRLVEHLRQRNVSREHALYAEGYALGRQDEREVLTKPTGKRANELRKRRLQYHVWAGRIPRGYVRVERERAPADGTEESAAATDPGAAGAGVDAASASSGAPESFDPKEP